MLPIVPLCYAVNLCCLLQSYFVIRNLAFYSYQVKQVESKCHDFLVRQKFTSFLEHIVSICLSIHPSYLSIHLSISDICLYIYPSINHIYLSIHPFIFSNYPSIHQSIISVYLSLHPSINHSHPYIHPSIISVYFCLYLSAHLSIHVYYLPVHHLCIIHVPVTCLHLSLLSINCLSIYIDMYTFIYIYYLPINHLYLYLYLYLSSISPSIYLCQPVYVYYISAYLSIICPSISIPPSVYLSGSIFYLPSVICLYLYLLLFFSF